METGGNKGLKELNLRNYVGETLLTNIYIYVPIMVN